jgi:hypothetical protein
MAMRKKPVHLEDFLQEQVFTYLRLQYGSKSHIQFFAVPNGGKRNLWEAARLKKQGVRAGVPDIFIFWNGGYGVIELKIGKNELSKMQVIFRDEWVSRGDKYALCRTLDSVIATLKAWGVK